jgi:hypothetical protein
MGLDRCARPWAREAELALLQMDWVRQPRQLVPGIRVMASSIISSFLLLDCPYRDWRLGVVESAIVAWFFSSKPCGSGVSR